MSARPSASNFAAILLNINRFLSPLKGAKTVASLCLVQPHRSLCAFQSFFVMDLIQRRTVRTENFESGSASQMSMAPATLRACLNCIFIWTSTHLMSFGHLMLLVCVLACPWVPEYSHFRLPYCIASLAIESP